MDDRSRLKDTLHLSHCITSQYLCPLFCASMVAKRLYAMVVTGPIPPEAEKTEVPKTNGRSNTKLGERRN